MYTIQRTKESTNPLTFSLSIILAFTIVTFSYSSQLSLAQNSTSSSQPTASFVNSFEKLVNNAHNLTQSYEIGYAKWKAHQYDNKTMISVTNNYLPKYQKLISESKALQPPKQYQNATDLYTKSLESELQSNNHFRNYLLTNNSTESKLSSKLLSDAFKYEIEAFKKLTSSGLFTIAP
ncbi:MAG: hypothetical protein WA631_02640 [Nitrososphaeraceae archaeon]